MSSALLERSLAVSRGLLGTSPAWLGKQRQEAMEHLLQRGLPTGTEEAWRFTDVSAIVETAFESAASAPLAEAQAQKVRDLLSAHRITFVNGRHAPELSSPAFPTGVLCESLGAGHTPETSGLMERYLGRSASREGNPFARLNTALFNDGVILRLRPGTSPAVPIHLVFLSTGHPRPAATHPRILILLEQGAEALVIESHYGPPESADLTNCVSEIHLGANASLHHVRVQRQSTAAFHLASVHVTQERGSRYSSHALTHGAAIGREDLHVILNGEGAECTLHGLYDINGTQLIDNHTAIHHAAPATTSRENYKGILDGRSRGVFNGRIVVQSGAQKTNAAQSNRNLLLSREALVNTTPQLEIFADDVKCRHGATIGRLDENQIFYLRSRGIAPEDAQRLLIHAFANEILEAIPQGTLAVLLPERWRMIHP